MIPAAYVTVGGRAEQLAARRSFMSFRVGRKGSCKNKVIASRLASGPFRAHS